MSSPSSDRPPGWPEPAAFEANAAGHLTPGQRRMLLGDPTPPPYVGLAVLAVAAVVGAALWWRLGFEIGLVVILVGIPLGLGAMGMNLDRRRRRRRLRADLDNPRLDSGVGEVIALPSGEVDVRAGMDQIEFGLAEHVQPPDGWYDMFWLEHPAAQRWNAERVLLSARPIPAPTTALAEVRARLREACQRTDWELGFNRAGQLSPPQRDELRRQARGRVWTRFAGVLVGTVASLLLLMAAVLAARSPKPDSQANVVGGIVIAALCLAVALWLTVRTALRLPAVVVAVRRSPPLASASGPVTVTLEDWENGVWKVAVADGPAFLVTADIARAFRTPVRYTVYYVERRPGNTLLAAEPTDRDPDHADRGRAWPRADWVAANAAGRLVAAQRIRIVGQPVGWGSVYLLLPAFVIVAGTAVPYISHHYAPERIVVGDGTDLRITLWIAAAVVGLWATAMVWSVAARRRRSAIVRRPHILTSTGQIGWLDGRYVIRGTRVRLSIPHRRHEIPEPGPYQLYWMRTPRPTLLSAEPLVAPDLA